MSCCNGGEFWWELWPKGIQLVIEGSGIFNQQELPLWENPSLTLVFTVCTNGIGFVGKEDISIGSSILHTQHHSGLVVNCVMHTCT